MPPESKASDFDNARAIELGRILRMLRDETGLNRPEFVAQMAFYPQGEIKPDYLNKLESGTRSFARATLEVREAIRLVAGVTKEDWMDLTGLFVPEDAPEPTSPRNVQFIFDELKIERSIKSRKPKPETQKRPDVPLPPGLQKLIDEYSHKWPELQDPDLQQGLAQMRRRGPGPETFEEWEEFFAATRKHFRKRDPQ